MNDLNDEGSSSASSALNALNSSSSVAAASGAPDALSAPDAVAASNAARGEIGIFILSDSIGDTAAAMVTAAMGQFGGNDAVVERLPKVSSIEQVRAFLEPRLDAPRASEAGGAGACTGTEADADAGVSAGADASAGAGENAGAGFSGVVLFMTIADPNLAGGVMAYSAGRGLSCVDLLGPAVSAIAQATGRKPLSRPGINHRLDEAYFRRIEAMDFAVDHDDGRLPEDYPDADLVLMGVSRTSKTPLSMYLASHGYKVANLPLAPDMTPPKEIFSVEPWRVFGLVSSPDVLADIRRRRLGPQGMKVAQRYASREYIERDLAEARALMRKIGCIVVHTDNRAIEETAQEILRYYNASLEARRAKDWADR